jgi:hypothetical protein
LDLSPEVIKYDNGSDSDDDKWAFDLKPTIPDEEENGSKTIVNENKMTFKNPIRPIKVSKEFEQKQTYQSFAD